MIMEKIELRYGENPHQKACFEPGQVKFTQLHGKELSYNNIVDMAAAMNIVSEFSSTAAAVIIKHNNPCGVALGETVAEAFTKALECDPISAFGGIIAFNQPVSADAAQEISKMFIEVVIAFDFEPEAVEILQQKKNIRLIKVDSTPEQYRGAQKTDIKETPFGRLVQDADNIELGELSLVTEADADIEQTADLVFAWKVAKHVKSNAIVVAKGHRTLGLGIGQTSRIKSMEIALEQAGQQAKGAVLASDGFFPATDNIEAAAKAGIVAIIQPGGSIKDADVIAECNKHNIAMVTTGVRHFRH